MYMERECLGKPQSDDDELLKNTTQNKRICHHSLIQMCSQLSLSINWEHHKMKAPNIERATRKSD